MPLAHARRSPASRTRAAIHVVEQAAPPAPALDVVASKLEPPSFRTGTVSRTGLVNRLRGSREVAAVIVVAPAGYGKTTSLAQWAARDDRPHLWVSLDERDDDPIVLLRHLGAALDRVEPLADRCLNALRSPGESVWATAVPRLTRALTAHDGPLLVVLDDADLVRGKESLEALAVLTENLPAGSTLVLAGRVAPALPIARMRAQGRLLEIGVDDLALSRREAQLLVRTAGAEIDDDELSVLFRQTEGWPAGLYLAALSVRDGRGDVGGFAGDDRNLADYFRAEYLAGQTPERLAFLRRTSVLETMSGDVCDAVLQVTDSARELESIERSNLFLVPLDRHRSRYRYHRLFRDLLRRELAEHEPVLAAVLHHRAADWYEAHDDPEAALEHAYAAGDTARQARILTAVALPAYYGGRVATVEGWLARFGDDDEQLERHPTVAVLQGWVHALRGRAPAAQRALAVAERGAETARPKEARRVRPWIGLLRSAMCRDGAQKMLADAETALSELPSGSPWIATAHLLRGEAHVLLGDRDQGDALLARAAEAAERSGATDIRILALGQRSVLAESRGDYPDAERLALEARAAAEQTEVDGYATTAIERATFARSMLRQGRWDQARASLTRALETIPSLTRALPWLAVQTRLELARTSVALRDAAGARALLTDAGEILGRRPKLGVLAAQADELWHELDSIPDVRGGKTSGLTTAELRLLPLLATHLSFREIGERLFVSRNTVKTQAISIYRKLGVSSRSHAVDQATRLGLLDAVAT